MTFPKVYHPPPQSGSWGRGSKAATLPCLLPTGFCSWQSFTWGEILFKRYSGKRTKINKQQLPPHQPLCPAALPFPAATPHCGVEGSLLHCSFEQGPQSLLIWGLWGSPGESPQVELSRLHPPHNGHLRDDGNL